MPSYISHEGIMYPAKEEVGLVNNTDRAIKHPTTGKMIPAGKPYIYEGPCRAAMYELYLADKTGKTTTFGQHFSQNTDFLQMVRNLGFKDKEEYLTFIGYDKKSVDEKFKESAAKVTEHEILSRVENVRVLGGGKDYAAGSRNNRYGGIGDFEEDISKKS